MNGVITLTRSSVGRTTISGLRDPDLRLLAAALQRMESPHTKRLAAVLVAQTGKAGVTKIVGSVVLDHADQLYTVTE